MPRYPHGLHAPYNGRDSGMRPRKGELSPKPAPSADRRLELAVVKVKSPVIAPQHGAVNTSLLLAHTARHVHPNGGRVRPNRKGSVDPFSREGAEVVTRCP